MPDEAANGPEVREAVASDAESIHSLTCELAGVVGDAYPDMEAVRARLLELLEAPRSRVLVAEHEDEIVGVVSFWIKPDLAHGDTVAEVPMLVVAGDHRGEGVGKLLVSEVQRLAAAEGASLIELVATRQNTQAREFYHSLGFVEADLIALEFIGDLEVPPDPDE